MRPLGKAAANAEHAARALLGMVLLALSLTPAFRLLDHAGTGLPGRSTVGVAESNLDTAWLGVGISLALGVVLAILIPRKASLATIGALGRRFAGPGVARWTVVLTVLATGLALSASLLLYRGLPTLADGMTSLLHARFLAQGHAAGAFPDPAAAWVVPNGTLTARGWVSQYPPMHPLLLALGLRAGVPWLVGPLLTGLLVGSTSLAAHHLLGHAHGGARLGSLLVAISPFVVFLGGGYLSHVSAAAFAALTLFAGLKARDGRWAWSVAAGASMGVLVTSRPWVGLFLGLAFTFGIWVAAAVEEQDRHLRRLVPRLAGAALGGAPFAVMWGIYNHRFFGHPLRLGYTANFGASHGLGFHIDPWGNVYGPLEGLGYTSADLLSLGLHALETSLPLIPVVAVYLILVRSVPRGAGVLLAWALLPLVANLFYWHHGSHLGPRMLYEAAPAWLVLASLAVVALARRLESDHAAPRRPGRRPSVPEVALWAIIASVPAMAYLVPLRISSYRWTPETMARITPPSPPGSESALVFVHGSWTERIAARLQADGFALDSLETGLRRTDTCTLHRWATIRLGGRTEEGVGPPQADFESLPGIPTRFVELTISPGNRILVDREVPWSPDCQREADADRGGVISLAPLLWQGDLPGIEDGKPLFVRDLGPHQNRTLMQAYPERRPYMLVTLGGESPPVLVPYEQGEASIWGPG